MGRDKTLIEWDGEPLVARVARTMSECCDEVLVASGDGERLPWLGLRQVADHVPESGPLAGIVAGLAAAASDLVAVVAADMPYASAAVFEALASSRDDEDAVVPVSPGGPEPLHAVYARSAAPLLRSSLDAGTRGVLDALAGLRVREVAPEVVAPADPSGRFAFNVNTPEELA